MDFSAPHSLFATTRLARLLFVVMLLLLATNHAFAAINADSGKGQRSYHAPIERLTEALSPFLHYFFSPYRLPCG